MRKPGPDGKYPEQILEQIHDQVRAALNEQYRILNEDLFPSLAAENIHFIRRQDWDGETAKWAREYFDSEVVPVVSPLGLDPAHPFPRLVNKSLNFILSLEGKDAFGRESGLAIVPAPRSLPRLIKVPREIAPEGDNFVFLSSIIHEYVGEFFPGMEVTACHQFRVTRNADLEMSNVEVEDVAAALQNKLHSRRFGAATKLEVDSGCPERLSSFLLDRFKLEPGELFELDGPVNLRRLVALFGMLDRPDLHFPKFSPGVPPSLADYRADVFGAVDKEDQLLLHPFQSFLPIIQWVREAADDPSVLSIKQTLYRTNESSELVEALAQAARNGKEVTVVIELRARFDEEENIHFARFLQEAGAVVVYGVLGYKTHAKMLLFVRRENDRLKRYAHLGTGNYHRKNSLVYTDYSLLTAEETICADVHKVFQQITGMGKKIQPKMLIHAPFRLRKALMKMIDNEKRAAKEGKPAQIKAKMNSLTDPPNHQGAVLGLPRGREDRTECEGHLLSAPRSAPRKREHPGRFRRRPLPGTFQGVLFPQQQTAGLLFERRLDGAQFIQPHRSLLPDSQRQTGQTRQGGTRYVSEGPRAKLGDASRRRICAGDDEAGGRYRRAGKVAGKSGLGKPRLRRDSLSAGGWRAGSAWSFRCARGNRACLRARPSR